METETGAVTGNVYLFLSHPQQTSTVLVSILLEECSSVAPYERAGHTQLRYGGELVEIWVRERMVGTAVGLQFMIRNGVTGPFTLQQSRIERPATGYDKLEHQIVSRRAALQNDYTVIVVAHKVKRHQLFSLLPLDRPFRTGERINYELQVSDSAPFLKLRRSS